MYEESNLITRSRNFAESVLGNLPDACSYHNLTHTREVVAAVLEIGAETAISREQLELVVLAAWFHDVGYSCGYKNHEDESARIMRKKLSEWNISPEKIEKIEKIIKATQMPQNPEGELAKIMCDADLYHLSTPNFFDRSERLRQELINLCHKQISAQEWTANNIKFLTNHNYFTVYAKEVLEAGKQNNLEKLKNSSWD